MQRFSLREYVRDYIMKQIGDGLLKPGERIVESRLTGQLNVSSIPVREAIRELVAIGVLESQSNRGAWVRQVSLEETIEALQVRGALESLGMRSAGEKLLDISDQLREHVNNIVESARKRDWFSFQDHNHLFHSAIMKSAGNSVLMRLWKSLGFEIRTRVVMDFLVTVDSMEIAHEHTAVVEAVDAGDIEKAARLMESHSDSLVAYIRQELDRQQEAKSQALAQEAT